jgi:hypothetical protein
MEHVARETGKPGDRFAIESGYGGYMLSRNDSDLLSVGYQSANLTYELMHAYLRGWRDCEDRAKRSQVAA